MGRRLFSRRKLDREFYSGGWCKPNFVKVAPVIEELGEMPGVEATLVHTGQHHDYSMSAAFFKDLELPDADVYLGVGSGTHGEGETAVWCTRGSILSPRR